MIEVVNIEENNDGSADITFNMSMEELKVFARIGLLKVLQDEVEN